MFSTLLLCFFCGCVCALRLFRPKSRLFLPPFLSIKTFDTQVFCLVHSIVIVFFGGQAEKTIVFYSLNFHIFYLANCQIHRKICHVIASTVIMKNIVMGLCSDSVIASNRMVSLSRITHTVDNDKLICGTVCSRTFFLCSVMKHVYKAHTHPHTLPCSNTHISSVIRQVRWQVEPLGLAIHSQ